MRLLHKLIFTVLSVLPLSAATAQDWDVVQVLPPANGFGTASIFDINNTGTIAGTACDAPSCIGSAPIIHQNSTSVFLDHPIQNTEAFGINNNNTVVGYTWDAGVQANVAEKWDSNGIRSHIGQYQNFTDTYAIDVNDSGVVIGRSFDRNTNQQAAWVWENGVFMELLTPRSGYFCEPLNITNSGVILGNCFKEMTFRGERKAIVWTPSVYNPQELISSINPEDNSTGYDIDDNGKIVGQVFNFMNSGKNEAAFWGSYLSAPMILLSPTRNVSGERFRLTIPVAKSINEFGNIVGQYRGYDRGGTLTHALYWHSNSSFPVDLSLYERVINSAIAEDAFKINSCNQILINTLAGPEAPSRIDSEVTRSSFYFNPTGCICGVNTQDANNNKIIDCMEPTAATKPPAPVIGVKGARVFVNVAVPPPGMGYKTVVQVYNSKNKRIGRKTTSGSQVEFKKLFGRTRKGQRLTVKANIYWTNGTITTQTSKRITKKFRVK